MITQGMLNLLENWGLRIPAVCLSGEVKILVPNRRQFGMITRTISWYGRDPTSNVVQMICDSLSMELFPYLLNEMIDLHQWFLCTYKQNLAYNFKKFIESLK